MSPRRPSAASTGTCRVLLVYRKFTSSFVYYPWVLTRAGLNVDVVCSEKHEIRWAKCISKAYIAGNNDAAFYSAIEERLKSGEYAQLLLIDEPSRTLMYHFAGADTLVAAYLPIQKDTTLYSAFEDKGLFKQWCDTNGIPVPRSEIVSTLGEAELRAREFGFPVVLKGTMGTGGAAVAICQTTGELETSYQAFRMSGRVMIQQFIDGAVGSTVFAARDGKIAAWASSEKYIALQRGLGPSAVRRTDNHPILGEIAKRMAQSGRVTGITGFDWMRTKDGEYLVVDPHLGRCTPPAVIAHLSGINLGHAVRSLIEGSSVIQEPVGGPRIIVLFPQVIELVLQGGLFTLLRKASPFRSDVTYFFGPSMEARLSLRILRSYLLSACKIWLGALKSRARPSGRVSKVAIQPR